jgi:AmmeMemoRadiSam system protein B/AmmeMemoRadiSam system protein A
MWALVFAVPAMAPAAGKIRAPVRAGSFYPSRAADLQEVIAALTRKARRTSVELPASASLKALILPHAGYVYSGWTAAHACLVLKRGSFQRVILLGPDHFIGLPKAAIPQVDAFATPLGKVPLDPAAGRLAKMKTLFDPLPPDLDREHSLEVVLPFLQTYLGDFDLVPILAGPHAPVSRLADALQSILGSETLLVVSSDLSHFLTYDRAVEIDRETLQAIRENRPALLAPSENRACGAVPIQILMQLAARNQWRPVQLHYANSGDTAGDRSRVVGYAAVAYFGETDMQSDSHPIDELRGQSLVKLARHTLRKQLGISVPEEESRRLEREMADPGLQKKCGTFVTLKSKGQLRGCIGSLSATEPLVENVKKNAVNAAFHDPRFAPLTADELADVQVEVSVLSQPQPLPYRDPYDLLQKLRPRVDGVIIRRGHASATFLPQVWQQLPHAEDFLGHLCMKAGLAADEWKTGRLEVQVYQVQYFEEPN